MTQVSRHYVLRTSKYMNGVPSGKADGMLVRNDGAFTDAKVSAKVFDTETEAELFYHNVVKKVNATVPIFVVPAVTKIVVKQVSSGSGRQL